MRRAAIILILFVLPVIVKLHSKCATIEVFFEVIGLATLRAIKFLMLLQAFFYIDLLDHTLQCLNEHLGRRVAAKTMVIATRTCTRTDTFRHPATKLREDIYLFKLLHFHFWEISEKINSLFGWTIVIIFLQQFFYATYNVYFAYFVMVQSSMDVVTFLRKSNDTQMQWKTISNSIQF